MSKGRPVGFWVLEIIGVLILLMLFVGQVMSYINYEFAVSIGMQESVDVIGVMGVAVTMGGMAGVTGVERFDDRLRHRYA